MYKRSKLNGLLFVSSLMAEKPAAEENENQTESGIPKIEPVSKEEQERLAEDF